MRWRSHVIIGAALTFAVIYLLGQHDLEALGLLVAFGALSALVPDLDHDSSKGRKILDTAVIAFSLLAVYLWNCLGTICIPSGAKILPSLILFLAIVGGYFIAFRIFKPRHRGITHTLAANAVFGIALWVVFGDLIAIAGAIGYFSHLLADQHVKII